MDYSLGIVGIGPSFSLEFHVVFGFFDPMKFKILFFFFFGHSFLCKVSPLLVREVSLFLLSLFANDNRWILILLNYMVFPVYISPVFFAS